MSEIEKFIMEEIIIFCIAVNPVGCSKTLWSPTGKARGTSIEIPSYACLREAASAKAGQGFGGLSTGREIHRSIKF